MKSRKEKSLYKITKKIVKLLKSKNGPVNVNDLSNLTCKRRCYDVILVLEAIGKVERCGKKLVQWCAKSSVSDPFDDDFIDQKIFED